MAGGSLRAIFYKLILLPFRQGGGDRSRPGNIIRWWELRRIPYNLILASAGILSGIVSLAAAGISESNGGEPVGMPDGIFLIAAPILFGIAANICYTGGWIVELLLRKLLRHDQPGFAAGAFASGVAFSVAVTFLPAVLAVLYLFGLLTGVVHPTQPTAR